MIMFLYTANAFQSYERDSSYTTSANFSLSKFLIVVDKVSSIERFDPVDLPQ